MSQISKILNQEYSACTAFVNFRASYTTDKCLAKVGSKVEKGESVSSLRQLESEHCL